MAFDVDGILDALLFLRSAMGPAGQKACTIDEWIELQQAGQGFLLTGTPESRARLRAVLVRIHAKYPAQFN